MPKFEVDIPHALTPEDARAKLERAAAKLEKDYSATCRWDGDRCLVVERKGLHARVNIEAARVHVAVELAFLMAPMAGAIKSGITKRLTDLLGEPPTPPVA